MMMNRKVLDLRVGEQLKYVIREKTILNDKNEITTANVLVNDIRKDAIYLVDKNNNEIKFTIEDDYEELPLVNHYGSSSYICLMEDYSNSEKTIEGAIIDSELHSLYKEIDSRTVHNKQKIANKIEELLNH